MSQAMLQGERAVQDLIEESAVFILHRGTLSAMQDLIEGL